MKLMTTIAMVALVSLALPATAFAQQVSNPKTGEAVDGFGNAGNMENRLVPDTAPLGSINGAQDFTINGPRVDSACDLSASERANLIANGQGSVLETCAIDQQNGQ